MTEGKTKKCECGATLMSRTMAFGHGLDPMSKVNETTEEESRKHGHVCPNRECGKSLECFDGCDHYIGGSDELIQKEHAERNKNVAAKVFC